MSWQQLKIQIRSEEIEPIEQFLLEHGAVSISYLDAEDQAVFQLEPGSTPLWDNTFLLCLFEKDCLLDETLIWLKTRDAVMNRDELCIELLEDQDWERSWMKDFHAMQFGSNLWICPSWQSPPDPDAINIILDPGMAFGSGTHATTSLCLRWLEQANLKDAEVVDYGCGSGVLAIAAVLLGAAKVHAVDNDPQAIAATIDNGQRNKIGPEILTTYLPDQTPQVEADILLANILAQPLIDLAPRLSSMVKPGGEIVLSGLLEDQAEPVLLSYQPWFNMSAAEIETDWVRLHGIRKRG